MINTELYNELATNFIEYAAGVNKDRSIPNATDGLKPVAKRILYGTFASGYNSKKPHVKCARIVGDVMGSFHPHGDSSIYGALVRLAQPWALRYPLIDFHGNMGNIDGDGPAAYRYTEARLSTLVEDGMIANIKKDAVDFVPNYDETTTEPVELPSIFPNLLCNPNSGIGVAMACTWAPHNLREVAAAINDYVNGKEPMLPGPDFPTGGVVINKNDIPSIMKTGHGSVKLRGKYIYEGNNIVFTEIPYGTQTETLMNEIGTACDEGKIVGVKEIRNESNKKGFRLVIECEKNASTSTIISKLFAETNLQTSFSYNQVALVNKTPTELNLKDCIKIYVDYNSKCIVRECMFDIKKATERLHIIVGLLKALDIIDDIIAMIKASASAAAAKQTLMIKWGFSEAQAQAILDMKLSKLAKLEKEDLEKEKKELNALLIKLQAICKNPVPELLNRLNTLVQKYGDDRRTELTQVTVEKEEKEIELVEPEKVVVVVTEGGTIKRIPTSSFRTQKKNGKGVKTQNDIASCILRTNTVDSLMIFSDKGQMYRLLVNDIPEGTNASLGQPIRSLVSMQPDEEFATMYSIYRDTEAKYVLFITKEGLIKKTPLDEYLKTKKKNGVSALTLRENDQLAVVSLVKDEEILIITEKSNVIRFPSAEVGATSRTAIGVKGIGLADGDKVVCALPIRDLNDNLALFNEDGRAKATSLKEIPIQKRGGKGSLFYKTAEGSVKIVGATLCNENDNVLITGIKGSICISCKDIPIQNKLSCGIQVIKSDKIKSITKV